MECVLAHVKPSAIKCPGGEWSGESKECFLHLVSESEVTYAKVCRKHFGALLRAAVCNANIFYHCFPFSVCLLNRKDAVM